MNKKIVAIIIPLMMVLSGVVVAANTVADDSPSTSSDPNKQNFIVGESFYLNVNEANYINYNYTAKWIIGDNVLATSINTTGTDGKRTITSSDPVSFNGVKYSVVAEKVIGTYKVITEADNIVFADTPIVWEISITIDNTENGSHKLTITKTLSPKAAEKLTFAWVLGDKHNNPIVNTFYNEAIVAKLGDTEISADSSPSYYAINLPNGLSMSSDGHINGIAKSASTDSVTAKIAVSYLDGDVKKIATGSLDIVVDQMSKIKFTMYLAKNSNGEPDEIKNESLYIAEKGDVQNPMKLSIKPSTEKWQANAHVKVVASNGVVSDESKYGETFDIPVNGTGAYTVIVEYAGETQFFTLYVLPAAELSANILISGN